jgi:hypothetical protein
MVAGEQHPDFGMLRLLFQLVHLAGQLRSYIFALGGKFRQRLQVVDLPGEPGIQLDIIFQAASCLQNRLRLLLIIPEFRLGYLFLQLENFGSFSLRIKDTLGSAKPFPRLRAL